MLVGKREQAEEWLKNHQDIKFQCIHCGQPLNYQNQSLFCKNNHQFDMAKQGYFYLSKIFSDTQYDVDLFKVRREIIINSPFYSNMHGELSQLMQKFQVKTILDAGSGEGSHLFKLIQMNPDLSGIGIDLAKEGIRLSTDYNQKICSAVSDLAALPLATNSLDCILSILSPANYHEFNRVLKHDGLLLKVIPNSNYLIEIRKVMADLKFKEFQAYDHSEVVNIFAQNYPNFQSVEINDKVALDRHQRLCITKMTPLTWSLSLEQQTQVANALPETISLSVTILVNQPL